MVWLEGGQGEVRGAPPPPPRANHQGFVPPPPPTTPNCPTWTPPNRPPTLQCPPPPPPPRGLRPTSTGGGGGGVAYNSEETAPPCTNPQKRTKLAQAAYTPRDILSAMEMRCNTGYGAILVSAHPGGPFGSGQVATLVCPHFGDPDAPVASKHPKCCLPRSPPAFPLPVCYNCYEPRNLGPM